MKRATAAIVVTVLLIVAPLSGGVALGASPEPVDTLAGSGDLGSGTTDGPGTGLEEPALDDVGPGNETNDSRNHPKVEDGLFDEAPGTQVAGPERTTVVVEARPAAGDRAARVAGRLGTVEVRHDDRIQVTLPRTAIPKLADSDAVAYVRSPIPVENGGGMPERSGEASLSTPFIDGPVASLEPGPDVGSARALGSRSVAGSVTSEGVAVVGADDAQAAGYDGEGVTVAVVDIGFDTDDPEIADRIVRTKDFSGTGVGGGRTAHGTATAEIVVDVAPKVNLVLVKATSGTEMLAAINYVDTQTDADVASMSLGLAGGYPLDGSSKLDRELDESVANGTVWSVSAGNEGDGKHWNGEFRDGDGDGYHNVTNDDETMNVEGPLSLRLQWADWPRTDQDYDVYVIDESGNVVASSQTVQNGSQPPYESVFCSCSGTHYVVIERVDADGTTEFDMFMTTGSTPEYYTTERSLTVPATAKRATTVGAVRYDTGDLESYSSRGPTRDGRNKPDVVAPTAVSTSAYPNREFAGTSASAPHVAGSAALVIDGDESLDSSSVKRRLRNTARPVLGSEPNTVTGWGQVDLTSAIRPQSPLKTWIRPGKIVEANQEDVEVVSRFERPPDSGEVVVELVAENGDTVTARAPVNTQGKNTVVSVNATPLPNGYVTARSKLVDGLGNAGTNGLVGPSNRVLKDVTEQEPGDFALEDDGLPDEVANGTTLEFEVNVSNDGGTATKNLSLWADADGDGVRDDAEVQFETAITLEGGNTTLVNASVDLALPNGSYDYVVRIGDATRNGSITVTEPVTDDENEPGNLERFDDGDGTIEFGEVLGAIQAFNDGEAIAGESVTFGDVLDLIAEFND